MSQEQMEQRQEPRGRVKESVYTAMDSNGDYMELVCGGCREPVSPRAVRCPSCQGSMETRRGRFGRRIGGGFGVLLIIGAASMSNIFAALFFGVIGLALVSAAAYWYWTRPVYRMRPSKRLREL